MCRNTNTISIYVLENLKRKERENSFEPGWSYNEVDKLFHKASMDNRSSLSKYKYIEKYTGYMYVFTLYIYIRYVYICMG